MRVRSHQLEAGLEEQLLRERIAHLHGRPLLLALVVELGRRQQAGAVDAVAPGARADVDAPGCRRRSRCARKIRSARAMPERERVDQDVAVVAGVEVDLAADGGHADAVAVVRRCPPPRRRTRYGVRGCVDGAEAQRVQQAIGRAPMVKTSRRMPPTPVAAPWNGSMNDGWLWLSILKTAAKPSPMSTAPAFSPGPWSTLRPGRRELLQVDARALVRAVLATTSRANMPSSVKVGVRPSTLARCCCVLVAA